MLALILGFITGLAGPITSTINKLTDLKIIKAQTESDVRRKEIDREIEATEDRKAVLVAEAGQRLAGGLNAIMRTAIAIGPASVLLKIFFWDKVIGSFAGCAGTLGEQDHCITYTTDKLDSNLWAVITAVVAFYFLYDISTRLMKR